VSARKATSNMAGLERTIRAMKARLDEADEALVALARGLAAAVDADPGNAALWREYRAAVTALSEVGTDDIDDDTQAFLLTLRTPVRTKVGDAKNS
jgi:site-specific recombinase